MDLGGVLDKCLEHRTKIIERTGEPPETVTLTIEEHRIILGSELLQMYIRKPSPPITKQVDVEERGFFSLKSHKETEYDYHAPEYLEALREWKIDSEKFSEQFPDGRIYGMKILIAEDSE